LKFFVVACISILYQNAESKQRPPGFYQNSFPDLCLSTFLHFLKFLIFFFEHSVILNLSNFKTLSNFFQKKNYNLFSRSFIFFIFINRKKSKFLKKLFIYFINEKFYFLK
jgi:hypothetical protein